MSDSRHWVLESWYFCVFLVISLHVSNEFAYVFTGPRDPLLVAADGETRQPDMVQWKGKSPRAL